MKKILKKLSTKISQSNKFSSEISAENSDEQNITKSIKDKLSIKIIVIVIVLSFAFFGVSGLFIGSSNSWVAKVGGEKISAELFYKTLETDRKIIRRVQPNNERLEAYLNSDKFRSDVLSRMIRKAIIAKVADEIGLEASEKIILSSVAKDENFRDKNGKFDRKKFQEFLAQNGLDELRYIREASDEVIAEMVMQSMVMATPVNYKAALDLEEFNQEKRVADIIKISPENIKFPISLSESDLNEFYNENKKQYAKVETRKIIYAKADFSAIISANPTISEEEIKAEYEKNRDNLVIPETRDFLHLSFADKEKAEKFIGDLNVATANDKSKNKQEFIKLAEKIAKKNIKEISFNKVGKAQLPEAIAAEIFKLQKDQLSSPIESQIGFHVALVNEIYPQKPIEFAEVKDSIRKELLAKKQENATQQKFNDLNDQILSSENLETFAKKHNFKIEPAIEIDAVGNDENGEKSAKIPALKDFAKIAFELKQGQVSKLIVDNKQIYALQVSEIAPAKQREFAEVKNLVAKDAQNKAKQEAAKQLAKSVYEQLKNKPSAFFEVAAANHLKVEKNQTLPRSLMVNLGGEMMPYKTPFLIEIFSKKIGEITSPNEIQQGSYAIAVVRAIKKAELNEQQQASLRKDAAKSFAEEIIYEYNQYLQNLFPIEINEDFFKNTSKDQKEEDLG